MHSTHFEVISPGSFNFMPIRVSCVSTSWNNWGREENTVICTDLLSLRVGKKTIVNSLLMYEDRAAYDCVITVYEKFRCKLTFFDTCKGLWYFVTQLNFGSDFNELLKVIVCRAFSTTWTFAWSFHALFWGVVYRSVITIRALSGQSALH